MQNRVRLKALRLAGPGSLVFGLARDSFVPTVGGGRYDRPVHLATDRRILVRPPTCRAGFAGWFAGACFVLVLGFVTLGPVVAGHAPVAAQVAEDAQEAQGAPTTTEPAAEDPLLVRDPDDRLDAVTIAVLVGLIGATAAVLWFGWGRSPGDDQPASDVASES